MAQAMQKQKSKEESVKKAIVAAVEVISEEAAPGGQFSGNEKVGDGTLIWIPDESLDINPHNPDTPEDREKAIKACKQGTWANRWVSKVLPSDAPESAREHFKGVLCSGLYD